MEESDGPGAAKESDEGRGREAVDDGKYTEVSEREGGS